LTETSTLVQDVEPVPASAPAEVRTTPESTDALGFDAAVRGLAELAAHRSENNPLTMALLGPAGSGKSFALGRLLDFAQAFSRSASPDSPFAPNVVIARVDASAGAEPAVTLAAGVYEAMRATGGNNAALAEEAVASGADPVDAVRVASERLIELRRRLDGERQTLRELSGRRARLAETVLYQAGGSRIDSWARANRGRIESRLRAFGFESGDPVATYKDLVRDVSDNRSLAARAGAFLHAMWAFRGQARLLVLAVVLVIIAWALGLANDTRGAWIGWIGEQGELGQSTAAWLRAQVGVLSGLRTLSMWAALGCVVLNIGRASRFVSPLLRGVALLEADTEAGQREIDSMIGNQTRLVDDLAAQADAQARRTEEAERRAASGGSVQRHDDASPFEVAESEARRQARRFLQTVAQEAARGAGPDRVIVAIDDLDALSPAKAAAFLDEAALLLARSPFIVVFAADAERLAQGWGPDGASRLARRAQIGVRIDAASSKDYAHLVRRLLAPREAAAATADHDAKTSIWDQPVSAEETELLQKLAPLAGRSPGAVAQFITVYRLARTRAASWPALAFALALDIGGTDDERASIAKALESADADAAFEPAGQPPRIADALAAARAREAGGLKTKQLREASAIAAAHSLAVR